MCGLVKHPHWIEIRKAINWAGFNLIHMKELDICDFLPIKRPRAILLMINNRYNLPWVPAMPWIKKTGVNPTTWDLESMQHPHELLSQAYLSEELLRFYSRIDIMPQSWKPTQGGGGGGDFRQDE